MDIFYLLIKNTTFDLTSKVGPGGGGASIYIYTLIFQFLIYLEPGVWLPNILATGSLVPNI